MTRWNLAEKLPFLLLSAAFLYSHVLWRRLCLGNSFLSNPIIHCLWNDETAGKISLSFIFLSLFFLFFSFLLSFIFFHFVLRKRIDFTSKEDPHWERAITISRVSYLPLNLRNKYCYREMHGGQTEGSIAGTSSHLAECSYLCRRKQRLKAKFPVSSWLVDEKGLCSWESWYMPVPHKLPIKMVLWVLYIL